MTTPTPDLRALLARAGDMLLHCDEVGAAALRIEIRIALALVASGEPAGTTPERWGRCPATTRKGQRCSLAWPHELPHWHEEAEIAWSDDIKPAPSPPEVRPYWSPEWVEPALTQHVRALGCKCEKPLIGYVPNVGPRCRLCGVEPEVRPSREQELRDALLPFARFMREGGFASTVWNEHEEWPVMVARQGQPNQVEITMADYRRAVLALYAPPSPTQETTNGR